MYVPNDPMRATPDDVLKGAMGFHPATDEARPMYEANRHMFLGLAMELNATIPESYQKTRMLQLLNEALMYANQAVAVTQPLA